MNRYQNEISLFKADHTRGVRQRFRETGKVNPTICILLSSGGDKIGLTEFPIPDDLMCDNDLHEVIVDNILPQILIRLDESLNDQPLDPICISFVTECNISINGEQKSVVMIQYETRDEVCPECFTISSRDFTVSQEGKIEHPDLVPYTDIEDKKFLARFRTIFNRT